MRARRKRRLVAAAELRDGAAAVGLVPDDDDRVAVAGSGGPHVVRACSGREPVVDERLAEPELACGLARAEQRAAEHRARCEALGTERVAELPRLLTSLRRQRPQLIRPAGRRLGMTNDQEAHRGPG